MPKVSVIMPVYNREALVGRAVESVFAQTFTDYEFIVIDDGSTDGTAAQLAAYGGRLQVISQPNRGAYAARNAGLARARGEYVAFLDSDDAWRPHRLASQVPLMEARPDVGLVYGDGRRVRLSDGREFGTFFRDSDRPYRDRAFSRLIRCNFIPQSSVLVRANCFRELGGFLELPMIADYHKWLEIARSHKIDFVEDVVFDYTMHEGNLSRDRIGRFRWMLRVCDALLASTPDPEQKQLIRSRRRTLEIETALVYVREGIRGFRDVLARPADGASLGERVAAVARVVGEHGPRLLRRRRS